MWLTCSPKNLHRFDFRKIWQSLQYLQEANWAPPPRTIKVCCIFSLWNLIGIKLIFFMCEDDVLVPIKITDNKLDSRIPKAQGTCKYQSLHGYTPLRTRRPKSSRSEIPRTSDSSPLVWVPQESADFSRSVRLDQKDVYSSHSRHLPLELFDSEDHNVEEEFKERQLTSKIVEGFSRYFDASGEFTWSKCSVLSYDRWGSQSSVF